MSLRRLLPSRKALLLAASIATLLGPPTATAADDQHDNKLLGAAEDKRVAVLLVNFARQPSEPWSKDAVRDLYFGSGNSVASYYSELSGGQVSISGSVFGYLTLNADLSSCNFRDWGQAARSKARAAGVVLSDFTNIVYVFPYQRSCWWNGFAGDAPNGPEGRDNWINGLLTLYVAVHELGHNFGVGHASSLTCTSGETRVAFSGNCSTYEYGDPFDVMGYGGQRLMHSWHRWELGLLPESDVEVVTESGNYHLSPVAFAGDGPRMLRIRRPNGGYYFLEIRQPFGAYDDFAADAPPVMGVSIRTASALVEANTRLIDAVPETCTFKDAPLPVGETFTDAINHISITTVDVDSTGADVQIQLSGANSPANATESIGTAADADTTPPTSVPRVSATQVTGKLVAIEWTAASDDVGVAEYLVSVDNEHVGTTCDLRLRGIPLKDGRTYEFGVQAVDGEGNVGPMQTASYNVPDFTSPTLPGKLSATVRRAGITLSWSGATDNVAVDRYRISRNGQKIGELDASARSYVDKTAAAGWNTYSVVAFDASGNASKPVKKAVKR